MKKVNYLHNGILILMFLAFIGAPVFIQITGIYKNKENFENRRMAQMPEINIRNRADLYNDFSEFINEFLLYINDNFPVRNHFFDLCRDIKMKIFHVSPIPSDVVIGESGWLFLGDKFGADIKESKGISVFSKQEIEKATKNILSYNAFLAEKKIKFYFCIAPNKLSVYNSYLPIQKSSRFTKVQQLTKELGKYQLNVIDLKDQFNLLPDIRLYHKHDSHWNQAGAFLGYLSIMKRIKKDFPGVSILKIEDFIINTTNSPYGDLTKNMLHMRVSEADITLTSIHKSTVVVSERLSILPKSWIPRFEGYTQRFKCEGKPLKVLVFCDSFFLNMVPFINRSFGETLVLNCLMNKDIVDTEKPDIIINETIERDIDIFLEMK